MFLFPALLLIKLTVFGIVCGAKLEEVALTKDVRILHDQIKMEGIRSDAYRGQVFFLMVKSLLVKTTLFSTPAGITSLP